MDENIEASPSPEYGALSNLLAVLADPEAAKKNALSLAAREKALASGEAKLAKAQAAFDAKCAEREAAIVEREAELGEQFSRHVKRSNDLDIRISAFEDTRVALVDHILLTEARLNRALGDDGRGGSDGSGFSRGQASQFATYDPRVLTHLKQVFRSLPDPEEPSPAPRRVPSREGFPSSTTITRGGDSVQPSPAQLRRRA
jgi:hypothetical protein